MQDRPLTCTVLVPAHNEAGTISRCIRAVQQSTYPVERLIVVADACTDQTAAIAKACGAEVHLAWSQDKAGAQNTVLSSITSDVLVGFDGDTFPEPDCIAKLMNAIATRGLDAAGGTVLPVQPRGFFIRARRFAYALGRRWWRISQSKVGRVQVLTGACYAFKTDAIQGVGGFPSVGISADMDATWALHRAGKRLAYVGDAVALTVDPETFSAYHAQMQRWAAGYFQTMAKHKRGLWHPKAILVVGTALFDLAMLPVSYALLAYGTATGSGYAHWYWAWMLGHAVVNCVLVATVVGWREALLGVVPYTLVNFYNKGLYLWTFFREWILGRRYGSWTGRHGNPKVIRPMTRARAAGLATCAALVGIAAALIFAPPPQVPPAPRAAPIPVQSLPPQPPNTVIHDPPRPSHGHDHGGTADTEPVDPTPVMVETPAAASPVAGTEPAVHLEPTTSTVRRAGAPQPPPRTAPVTTTPSTVPPTTPPPPSATPPTTPPPTTTLPAAATTAPPAPEAS